MSRGNLQFLMIGYNHAVNFPQLITISQASSSLEISRLRRKYKTGMPLRVTEYGIPPISIPYGYRKPLLAENDIKAHRRAVPEQDPALVAHILTMRDMLLNGASGRQIAADLNQNGIPAPRGGPWSAASVLGILRNPFYAGRVSWGLSTSETGADNKRTRTRKRIPTEQAAGRHVPLWDQSTHEAILAEIARHQRSYVGRRNNQLTGLLRCGVCGSALWRQGNGPRQTSDRKIWRCSATGSAVGHVNIPHQDLLDVLATALDERLRRELESPAPTPKPASAKTQPDLVSDLLKQQERLETAYLQEVIDLERYRIRKADLDRKLDSARDSARRAEQQTRQRSAWRASASALASLTDLRGWILSADPFLVNHTLRLLIDHITVKETGIEIAFK